jgi:hypothetical protein
MGVGKREEMAWWAALDSVGAAAESGERRAESGGEIESEDAKKKDERRRRKTKTEDEDGRRGKDKEKETQRKESIERGQTCKRGTKTSDALISGVWFSYPRNSLMTNP